MGKIALLTPFYRENSGVNGVEREISGVNGLESKKYSVSGV